MFGDHGCDVVKVEAPGGDATRLRGPFEGGQADPERSGLFLALHTNKRGICLDLETIAGRDALGPLLDWAELLVHDLRPGQADAYGLSPVSLEARWPGLVTLSITPFGAVGPYAEWQATELTVSSGGGWANLCPAATARPELPPLKVYGHQCALMSGIAAATAAMAAVSAARRSGVGEFIDFSEQAYTASVLENAVPQYTYQGVVATRYGTRLLIPWGIFECRDRPLFIACMEQDQWDRLVDFMGRPDWATIDLFGTQRGRGENYDVLHNFLQEWLADRDCFETYHAMQAHRICAAPVLDPEAMAESPHLQERGFFAEVEHARAGVLPYLAPVPVVDGRRQPIRRAAPLLGEHDAEVLGGELPRRVEGGASGVAGRPLSGLRVIDLTWAWAGPFCAMNLAHLGAEVIRFESAGRPDLYRRLPVHPPGIDRTLNTTGMFNQWNQGKKSVALDLSKPRGVELLRAAIAKADVVIENFATGVMERLGLGYRELAAHNPRLIMASISGYGQTGPYANYMGYGPAIPPLTGIAAGNGFVGGGPTEIGISMPDPTAGITAALQVCAALEERHATGRGGHVDISLWEATAAFAIEGWMDHAMNGKQPEPQGSRDPWMAPHGFFPTAGEDDWVAISVRSDEEWQTLCGALAPELGADARFTRLADRKRNEDALEDELSRRTRERDRWEWTRTLQGLGLAVFPAYTAEDIVEDPHHDARGFIEQLPHPEVGERKHAGIPYILRRRPNGVASAAPALGQHSDEVLSDLLGLSAEEIAALHADEVLR
jgi:crotonobetainyl-CoA:carnitine CoA-transferase CaiB-like acyl-CoA transferase